MQHFVLSCSRFLPRKIKIIQMVLESQERIRNQIKSQEGEITPKVRKPELSCTSCPVLHFYEVSSKYSKGCSTYKAGTKSMHNHGKIQQKEITPKVIKAELSFLYATRCLVLFYISTKYHQNIPSEILDRCDGCHLESLP